MEEYWKTHPILTDYEGSNLGRIRSTDRLIMHKNGKIHHRKGKVIKPQSVRHNYLQFHPKMNTNYYVHRFIWECFYGPIPEGLVINHLDEDPTNNALINLSLVTQADNLAYGTRLEKCLKTRKANHSVEKPVNQYDMDGNFITWYPSVKAAAAVFGKSNTTNICSNLKGRTTNAYGYVWKYRREA